MKKKKISQNNTIGTAVAILVVFLLAATSFTYYYFFSPLFTDITPKTKVVSIPEISTHITASDGEAYAVDASISFEFTEYVPSVSRDQLMRLTEEAVASLDYDKLMQPGSVSYIQDTVRKKIAEYVSDQDIVGVYISELQSGDYRISEPYVPPSDVPREKTDNAKKLFEGLK